MGNALRVTVTSCSTGVPGTKICDSHHQHLWLCHGIVWWYQHSVAVPWMCTVIIPVHCGCTTALCCSTNTMP